MYRQFFPGFGPKKLTSFPLHGQFTSKENLPLFQPNDQADKDGEGSQNSQV